MMSLKHQAEILKESKGGRRQVITQNMLIEAIGKYQTASPTELIKKLEKDGIPVSRRTIYRKMKQIPPELIEATLAQVTEDELKPEHRSQSAFNQLPIVKKYSEALRYVRETSPAYHTRMMNGLFWLCQTLNKNPSALQSKDSVDLCARLVMQIKKGEITRNLEAVMTVMRSWYQFIGIAMGYLTGRGITGERRNRGKRSRIKFTEKERAKVIHTITTKFSQDFTVEVNGRSIGVIPFASQPETQQAMIVCVKFLFYTGTRRKATLEAQWQDVTWRDVITKVHVIDKGKHKLGRIEWNKEIAGEFLAEFRAFWKAIGSPTAGRIFPFRGPLLSCFFSQIYTEAGIPQSKWKGMPCHIWRHTACQECLEVTNWNKGFCAKFLGWESEDTMTKHYGEASPEAHDRALLVAMGLPVPEKEKKEFKF